MHAYVHGRKHAAGGGMPRCDVSRTLPAAHPAVHPDFAQTCGVHASARPRPAGVPMHAYRRPARTCAVAEGRSSGSRPGRVWLLRELQLREPRAVKASRDALRKVHGREGRARHRPGVVHLHRTRPPQHTPANTGYV